jgi:hypothetical protein
VTDPDQRLERARTAFVRHEFLAPIATILELTEILIEDARRSEDKSLVSDLGRVHSAGLLLRRCDTICGLHSTQSRAIAN